MMWSHYTAIQLLIKCLKDPFTFLIIFRDFYMLTNSVNIHALKQAFFH